MIWDGRQIEMGSSRETLRRAGKPQNRFFRLCTLLDEILKNLQAGTGVSVIPELQQITTQHDAKLLGVFRPFLVPPHLPEGFAGV